MKSTKKLGIWMDHSFAHIMEFTSRHFEIETIESEFITQKPSTKTKNSAVDNTQKKKLSNYYRKIGDYIQNYHRVILFGPTNAKIELFDFLSEDERFLKIKFEIKDTDKMTQSQQHSFVKEYFS